MPFGEELYNGIGPRATNLKYGTADTVRQKFTGYQKDNETGLDFAEARMYENRHGRFTAVDPLLASGKSANPQTFNRYVYVMNSPLAYTDPTGLQVAQPGDDIVKCQRSSNCNTTFNDGTASISDPLVTMTVWIQDAFTELLETFRVTTPYEYNFSNGQRAQALDQLFEQVSSSDPLQNANYNRFQSVMNLTIGSDDGGLTRSIFGFKGVNVFNVLQQGTESYEAARQIGEANLIFQSFYTNATAGYLRGYQFSKGISTGTNYFGGRNSSESGEGQKFAVIGRTPDTYYFKGLRGAEVFKIRNWTVEKNDAWVSSVIDRQMPVSLASPLTRNNLVNPPNSRFPQTVFGREVQMFQEAGYYRWGNSLLIPPR